MNTIKWLTSEEISKNIALRLRAKRKYKGLSQKEIAKRSGVSYGSVKRFEQTGEISFASLIKLASVLSCENDFDSLFSGKDYSSIDEVIRERREAFK